MNMMKQIGSSIILFLLYSLHSPLCRGFVVTPPTLETTHKSPHEKSLPSSFSSLSSTSAGVIVDTSSSGTAGQNNVKQSKTHLIFPGGGIFFYWQAGVITYLREQNYNLLGDHIQFTGASAGALCATLTCTNVDFEQATELALSKAEDAGVWDRPLGLYGIWGDMIEEWLDELLPEDSLAMTEDKLSLLVTQIPSFSVDKISSFRNKNDLIRCNMASVHIPLFLNGKLVTDFRSKPHIDGSFIAKPVDFHNRNDNREEKVNLISLEWKKDPILSDRKLGDAVNALSKEGIWDLLEQGRSYAVKMEKRGDFDSLLKL